MVSNMLASGPAFFRGNGSQGLRLSGTPRRSVGKSQIRDMETSFKSSCQQTDGRRLNKQTKLPRAHKVLRYLVSAAVQRIHRYIRKALFSDRPRAKTTGNFGQLPRALCSDVSQGCSPTLLRCHWLDVEGRGHIPSPPRPCTRRLPSLVTTTLFLSKRLFDIRTASRSLAQPGNRGRVPY